MKSEVDSLFRIELQEQEDELGGIESEKVQRRIAYVKTSMAELIQNAGKFNFTMMEWAIKEIVKEEAEERKKVEEAEKKAKQEQMGV